MTLQWQDVQDIAIALSETKTGVDPRYVNFVDLRQWILALDNFSGDPERCGEKILEAIQAAWIEEVED